MKHIACALVVLTALMLVAAGTPIHGQGQLPLQFVFTSDAHYGITRPTFRGGVNVAAFVVNHALVQAINALPGTTFPRDGGLRSGEPIGGIDFLAHGGDIANREEGAGESAIQPASVSWSQFVDDYVHGLTLVDGRGRPSTLFVVPGNHESSNAVGFHRPMTPATDPGAYAAIYNLMMKPPVPVTSTTFEYRRDKVLASRDIGGVHVEFISIWPDSQVRQWMEADLRTVPTSTPVMVFAHDQPEVEAKHFRNPNGAHTINPTDQFENLLADEFTSGTTTETVSVNEQRLLERFLSRHPNVTAYFHGNSNWNQFYDWVGPDHSVRLHTFRVDSPMKGGQSAADETKLSFQLAVIDPASLRMTVREVLWNTVPGASAPVVQWGGSTTVAISPPRESTASR